MARKRVEMEDEYAPQTGGLWATIKDSLKIMITQGIKSSLYEVMDAVSEQAIIIQRRMMKMLAYYFLLGLSIIFLSIALVRLLDEYLGLSIGWSYLIIGGALLIGALLMKNKDDG